MNSSYAPVRNSQISLQKLLPTKRLKLPVLRKRRWLSFEFKRRWNRLVHDWWAWEFLASAISIVATVALIITLAVTDGHKQPEWGIAGAKITLNAIVAAISTVIRTALMIAVGSALNQNAWNWFASRRATETLNAGKPLGDLDAFADAGSDPWASLMLIWRTRGRALAVLGAFLVIFSLAFDTFAQQVLTTRTRPTNEIGSNNNGTSTPLPRSMAYLNQRDSSINSGDLPNAPGQVEAAIISGLLAANTSEPVGRCPTGDCSWPLTPSLGVCSSCTDLSSQIWLTQDLLPDTLEFGINTSASSTSVDMTYVNYINLYGVGSVYFPNKINSPSTRLMITEAHFLGVPPPQYASFLQVLSKVPDNSTIRHIPWDQVHPLLSAHSCSLYFCIKAFEAKTTAGAASESVARIWDQFKHTDDGLWTPVNVPSALNLHDTSAYRVENLSVSVLGLALSQLLSGTVEVWYDIPDPLPADLPLPHYIGKSESLMGSFTEAVWHAANSTADVTDYFNQLATSFTNFMRTSPSLSAPEDDSYLPTVLTTEVYVHVRWGWLAFPLALLLFGLVFLALTIWQTKRMRVLPWKGARLPLLLASIDDEVRQAAKGGLLSRSGLEERVGNMKVRLEYSDGDDIAFERVS